MRINFARMVSLALAFGFFIGCSTLFPEKKQTQGVQQTLSRDEITGEIEQINRTLEDSGESAGPEVYYRKGFLLSELAQLREEPEARTTIYREMRKSLMTSENLYNQSGQHSGKQKVDELLNVKWSNEHNKGVEIIQNDSLTLKSEDYEQAAAHFKNATLILPDSAISYKMEAKTRYRNHQPDQAIAILEKARAHIDPLPPEMLEQLAFLYLETGQAQNAVNVYEEAESFSGENLNVMHGLANAYISAGKHEEAVELLNLLVESEPENIIYAQTLGTELYFLGEQRVDEMVSSSDPKSSVTAASYQEVNSLFTTAEKHLTQSLDSNPDNNELEQKLAYFYKNSAAAYQRMLPYLPGDLTSEVKQKIESLLQSSIPLFVTLTEKNPEKKPLWKNLHQVYTYLEMKEKAEEIESKAN